MIEKKKIKACGYVCHACITCNYCSISSFNFLYVALFPKKMYDEQFAVFQVSLTADIARNKCIVRRDLQPIITLPTVILGGATNADCRPTDLYIT